MIQKEKLTNIAKTKKFTNEEKLKSKSKVKVKIKINIKINIK